MSLCLKFVINYSLMIKEIHKYSLELKQDMLLFSTKVNSFFSTACFWVIYTSYFITRYDPIKNLFIIIWSILSAYLSRFEATFLKKFFTFPNSVSLYMFNSSAIICSLNLWSKHTKVKTLFTFASVIYILGCLFLHHAPLPYFNWLYHSNNLYLFTACSP